MKEDSFEKKLAAYMAMAAAALAAGTYKADAQVIYTDVNPDGDIQQEGWWNLDLNNDGITDFKFSFYFSSSSDGMSTQEKFDLRVEALNDNYVMANGGVPQDVEWDDTISVNNSFIKQGPLQYHYTWQHPYQGTTSNTHGGVQSGIWWNGGPEWLGLKLKAGGLIYYGWARISHLQKVCNYAYNATPEEPVIAGRFDVKYVPSSHPDDSATIFNTRNLLFIIDKNGIFLNGTVRIIDVIGCVLIEQKIVSIEQTISLSNLIPGMYFAELNYEADDLNIHRRQVLKFEVSN